MPAPNQQLKKQVSKLQKDVVDLKTKVRFLQSILIKADNSEQAEKDRKELKKIEEMIEDAA